MSAAQPSPPATLHELLALALSDFEVVAKDPHYIISMSEWHVPLCDGEFCAICLAGAVLTRTLKVPDGVCVSWPQNWLKENGYDENWGNALLAIDAMRQGRVSAAWSILHSDSMPETRWLLGIAKLDRPITPHSHSHVLFMADMYKLLADLQAAGI